MPHTNIQRITTWYRCLESGYLQGKGLRVEGSFLGRGDRLGRVDLRGYDCLTRWQDHRKAGICGLRQSDYAHCVQMVTALAGNTHRIYTAHTVLFNGKKHGEWVKEEWVTSAEVTFGEIPPEVIAEFAKQPEPYLHSGGYELTAMSGGFLKSINGSHSAVQGLDMHEICWSLIRGGKKLQWF